MQACEFKAYEFLSKDYRTFDASELLSSICLFGLSSSWITLTGRFHTNAAILRDATGPIQVVDACDLH